MTSLISFDKVGSTIKQTVLNFWNGTNLCYLSQFSMVLVLRKNNSNIAQIVQYIKYLVTIKHIDFFNIDFDEFSLKKAT